MYVCRTCSQDLRFLRRRTRPKYEEGKAHIRVVDLFSGCGGLTLGTAEAARRLGFATDVILAVDFELKASEVFKANFPHANVICDDVARVFDGRLGRRPTTSEASLSQRVGSADILLSGAPCQGHSDLNNHTRRRDPRNVLYLRSVRAAEILKPSVVLLENVPAVLHDEGRVIEQATARLEAAGYDVADTVLNLADLGVPQVRHRHFLLGCLEGCGDPLEILGITSPCVEHLPRSLQWAINDLRRIARTNEFDSPSRMSAENEKRIRWLFDNKAFDLPNGLRPRCHRGNHSYRSMYGRLRWGAPAQTITTGFGSMGQGRYVHPSQRRTLTPHEAARLQAFPDFFDFGPPSRGAWARMIGNAVPPLVTVQIGERILPLLEETKRLYVPPSGRRARDSSKRAA